MNDRYIIKNMDYAQVEKTHALDLVWTVFLEFEAPEYSDEGVKTFRAFISPHAVQQCMLNGEMLIWGCFDEESIVGVIAARSPCHISLLFVDKAHHRQGIAKALYQTVLDHYTRHGECTEITVHSSPYALEVYRKLGFTDTDAEQTVNGLRFIPMKHTFQ